MVQIHIPCAHNAGTAQPDEVVSDYHPLTKADIGELLDMSTKTDDAVELARIQVRLMQGIKGMTCPRPYDDGPVSRNDSEMCTLFVDRHREGGTEELVDLFDKLLNW